MLFGSAVGLSLRLAQMSVTHCGKCIFALFLRMYSRDRIIQLTSKKSGFFHSFSVTALEVS